jgi:hypothetical protein
MKRRRLAVIVNSRGTFMIARIELPFSDDGKSLASYYASAQGRLA